MPRGRPKKTAKKKTKRGPGRPKGSKNKKAEKKVTKKRRGRPPKKAEKKVTKKRRGRPPKKAANKTKKTKRATGKAMTKMQIASYMADLHDMKKSEARDFIANFVKLAVDEVKKNGSFSIPGLGKFVKKRRKARNGRNPATGEKIRIKAKTVVKARVSKSFKDEVL